MIIRGSNKVAQAVLLVAMSVTLVNCAPQSMKGAGAVESEELTSKSNYPHPPLPKNVSLSYRSWGGYPGPNGPIYTNLDITPQNGAIVAKLETASCASKMNIAKAEFDELVAMINNSPYYIGVGFMGADAGSRTVVLQSNDANAAISSPSHLTEDDTSRGQRVLSDGPKIGTKISALVVRLSKACQATCLPK